MIEREIPKDIRKYKTKLIGPFSFRQTICLVIAAVCSLVTYNTIGKLLVLDARAILCFIVAAPALITGWIMPYGMPFEKFVKTVLFTTVLAPTKRIYKTANIYDLKTPEENAAINREKKKRIKSANRYKKKSKLKPELKAYR